MNGIQKVIKYSAIALAVFIIVSIFSLLLSIVSSIVDIDSDDEVINYKETYENVDKIKIDISSAKLNIKQGDTFKVEANDINDKFESKLTNGTLKIDENAQILFNTKTSEITVYVPNVNLALIDIDAGAGSINIENVNTDNFDLDQGAGSVRVSNSNFLKADIDGGAGEFKIQTSSINNLDLDAGIGKVDIEATLTGKNQIDCGIGEVNLDLIGNDYTIKTHKGLGSININGESQSNDSTYGNGLTELEIKGGIGSINITTQKR